MPDANRLILVTGGSGYIGSRVARLLADQGAIACVRNLLKAPSGVPTRIADYDKMDSLLKAFARVDTLVFIPSDGFAEDMRRHCRNVIEAASFCGVKRVVFLSILDVGEGSPFYYAPVYRGAEQLLRESGLNGAIVRCGLYSDFVESAFVRPARSSGVLSTPAGRASVRMISRDEVAAQLAQTARDPSVDSIVLDIPGMESKTFSQIAEEADLEYRDCDPDEYLDRVKGELEDPWPEAFATLFESIREERFT